MHQRLSVTLTAETPVLASHMYSPTRMQVTHCFSPWHQIDPDHDSKLSVLRPGLWHGRPWFATLHSWIHRHKLKLGLI